MTRKSDIVVALDPGRIEAITTAFADEYYIDPDMIVRKSRPYRIREFTRRQRASLGNVETWIVSREDLILSKLAWSATSELRRRDVGQLLAAGVDVDYLRRKALELGVRAALDALLP